MTPEQKAIELVAKFKKLLDYEGHQEDFKQLVIEDATKCAVIGVEEILNNTNTISLNKPEKDYWQSVLTHLK